MEKTIRNLGIPYKGSKNKVAFKIVGALPTGGRFVDGCCGGGAILEAAALSGKYSSCTGLDASWSATTLLSYLLTYRDDPLDLFAQPAITREQFMSARSASWTNPRCAFALHTASFGYNAWDYLYSKDKEEIGLALNNLILEPDIRKRLALLPTVLRNTVDGKYPVHPDQVSSRVRLLDFRENMQKVMDRGVKVEVEYNSMFQFDFSNFDVIYFDPPYKATKNPTYQPDFDREEFILLIERLAESGKKVFVSEYELESPLFTSVLTYEKRMTQSAQFNGKATEHLYFGGSLDEYNKIMSNCDNPETGVHKVTG